MTSDPTAVVQHRRRALGLGAAVIVADQASKWWMMDLLSTPPHWIDVTPFFNLVVAWNRGVSFGLFNSDGTWNAVILSGVALVIVVALLIWLNRCTEKPTILAIGLVVGGAIGNVIDRARFGAVFDFLDVHVGGWHWPAFNVADSAITIGAVILVVDGLFGADKNRTLPESGSNGGNAS